MNKKIGNVAIAGLLLVGLLGAIIISIPGVKALAPSVYGDELIAPYVTSTQSDYVGAGMPATYAPNEYEGPQMFFPACKSDAASDMFLYKSFPKYWAKIHNGDTAASNAGCDGTGAHTHVGPNCDLAYSSETDFFYSSCIEKAGSSGGAFLVNEKRNEILDTSLAGGSFTVLESGVGGVCTATQIRSFAFGSRLIVVYSCNLGSGTDAIYLSYFNDNTFRNTLTVQIHADGDTFSAYEEGGNVYIFTHDNKKLFRYTYNGGTDLYELNAGGTLVDPITTTATGTCCREYGMVRSGTSFFLMTESHVIKTDLSFSTFSNQTLAVAANNKGTALRINGTNVEGFYSDQTTVPGDKNLIKITTSISSFGALNETAYREGLEYEEPKIVDGILIYEYAGNWYSGEVDVPTIIEPEFTSSAFSGAATLRSFDVEDNTGAYILTRTSDGTVRIHNGATVSQVFQSANLNCNMLNGIASIGANLVAYLRCTGAADIDEIHFKQADGTDPVCDSDLVCDYTLGINDLVNENEWDRLAHSGLSNFVHSGTGSGERDQLNIQFTTTDGNVGTFSLMFRTTAPQLIEEDNLVYTDNPINGICAVDDNFFVVDTEALTNGYIGEIATGSGASVDDINLASFYTSTAGRGSADMLGCTKDSFYHIIRRTTEVKVIDTTVSPAVDVLTRTTLSGHTKGIDIAKGGGLTALVHGDVGYIINTTSGNISGYFRASYPTSSLTGVDTQGIEVIANGNTLYLITTTQIRKYDITDPSSGIGDIDSSDGGGDSIIPPPPPPPPPGPTDEDGDGFDDRPFGIDISYTSDGLDISEDAVRLLIGLILMVVFAIWLYRGTESVLMSLLGAGSGLMVATVIGLVSPWVVMAIVLALLIIFGKMVFGGADEES